MADEIEAIEAGLKTEEAEAATLLAKVKTFFGNPIYVFVAGVVLGLILSAL